MKIARGLFVVALVVCVVAAAGFFVFQRQIGGALFASAVRENLAAPEAQLDDGLHVYVCGSGAPMPDPTRAGPCLAVLAGDRGFVFDAGSGSARVLGRMGFPMARLERVYLTHLHSDHFDGLGELLLQAWVGASRDAPLPVAGPEGVAEVVAGFNAAYRLDSTFRTAHHGAEVANPAGFGGAAETIVAPIGGARVILEEGDLRISVIPVAHAPASPAFGYRIDYKGRSVAISGDTAYSDDFVAAAEGVDVMFHEALAPALVAEMGAAAEAQGQANLAKIMADIPGYHSSPEEAARAASEAGAGALVLYHVIPPLPSRLLYATYLGDARRIFRGRLTIGEDGMRFDLPAGSDEVRRTQAMR